MSDVGTARIEGLRDFNRAVKRASTDTAKALNRRMKTEVADPVAQTIRGNVPVKSGRWKRSIKPGATAKGAHITWGRSTVPYAGWMEFGGRRAGGPGGSAVAVRTRTPDGRYVWPEVGRARGQAEETAQQILQDTFRQARLDLRSGASL